MRKLNVVFLAALVGVGWAGILRSQAPGVPTDEQKGFASINAGELRGDVTYLASDRLLGRMSLEPGDAAAVRWIVGQFAHAGLDPAVMKRSGVPSYEQSFEVVEYRPDRVNTTVTLVQAGKTTVWHAPQAFGAYKHAVDVTAPVVFAGYGITAPELHYDDYAGLNVKGKIVVAFDHEPQEDDPRSIFNGTGNTRYATTRVKLLNAQEHGAVALVVVAEPNRKHLTNAERAARIGGSLARTTPLPLQAIADDEVSIPVVLILDDALKQLLATSGKRGSALQSKIDADLTPQSIALPETVLTLHLRNMSERTGWTSNVAALLQGSDPKLRAETILISAHHDHDGSAPCPQDVGGIDQAGTATPAGPQCVQVWHGADDNASGTTGVVTLAQAFGMNRVRPRRSILFVVFASEERGLLGSYWMAAHPVRPLATTRAMINFDMIGRDEKPSPQTEGLIEIPADTDNRLNLIGALYSPAYKSVVREENLKVGLLLDDRFDHESALNVLFRSDQFPFLLHNVPAFWWFTGFHPDYHHITDTAEKLDYAKMTKILQLAYLTAWRFGTDDQVPKFVENLGAPMSRVVVPADEQGEPLVQLAKADALEVPFGEEQVAQAPVVTLPSTVQQAPMVAPTGKDKTPPKPRGGKSIVNRVQIAPTQTQVGGDEHPGVSPVVMPSASSSGSGTDTLSPAVSPVLMPTPKSGAGTDAEGSGTPPVSPVAMPSANAVDATSDGRLPPPVAPVLLSTPRNTDGTGDATPSLPRAVAPVELSPNRPVEGDPVALHRPASTVKITGSTAASGDSGSTLPPAVAPVLMPGGAQGAPTDSTLPPAVAPVAMPSGGQGSGADLSRRAVAPVAMPGAAQGAPTDSTLPPPVAPVALPSGGKRSDADSLPPAVAPVVIPAGPQAAPADTVLPPPVAPVALPASPQGTAVTGPGVTGLPPVAPVEVSPGSMSGANPARGAVTKVQLGGGQPVQDNAEKPQ